MAALSLRTWFLILLGLSLPSAILIAGGIPTTSRAIGNLAGSALGLALIPFAVAAIWRSMQKMKTETPYTVSLVVFIVLAGMVFLGS